MTPKQYSFAKNARLVAIALAVVYFIFGAGAIFTGFKPNFSQWVISLFFLVQLVGWYFNKPTPPPSQ